MDHPGRPLQASDNTPESRAVGSPAPSAELPHPSGVCVSPSVLPDITRACLLQACFSRFAELLCPSG